MAIFHSELVDYDSNLAQLLPIGAGPEIHGDGPVDGGSNKTLCVHIYIYNIHIYIIYTYIYIHMCVCMNIYIYIYIVCTCMYIWMYICNYIYIYVGIHWDNTMRLHWKILDVIIHTKICWYIASNNIMHGFVWKWWMWLQFTQWLYYQEKNMMQRQWMKWASAIYLAIPQSGWNHAQIVKWIWMNFRHLIAPNQKHTNFPMKPIGRLLKGM